jgi:acyl-CoA synthetase (AMP-forming)/AMP-acid ligase II
MRDMVTGAARRRAYEAAGWWDGTTLPARVAAHARRSPRSVAVVDAAGRHDYAALWRDAIAVARHLRQAGVRPGDVVSVQLPNRYEAVAAAVAVLEVGAVLNPLLPNYRHRELGYVVSTARPAAIFTPATYRGLDHRGLVAEVRTATGTSAHHVVVGGDGGDAGWDEIVEGGGEVTAAPSEGRPSRAVSELIFTSGTEANPKAVMHTEQTTNFSARAACSALGLDADDVVWMPSPVGHSTGFNYGVRVALYHRLPLVLQDLWDPAAAVELIIRERCSYTLAATTFLQDVVAEAASAGTQLQSLRYFGCGGAPVPAALVDAAAATGIDVLRLYGSTEVLVATWNRPDSPPDKKRRTDGRALDHVDIQTRDDDGRPCSPGEPGELHVRGPDASVGFFADPERTAATFAADGWVRSGDLVTLDADGYVTVVGRKKEIIIRGGINIAPREIEDLLVSFPDVERAAVVGLPDPRLGERSCACVVLAPGATLDLPTVVSRLRSSGLATYKLPERLEILDALPSTASGKVQKHEIVRLLTEGGRP